ncbi:MAG: hypothetical protein WA874_15430, partial [Chryseosolibacter sp.]
GKCFPYLPNNIMPNRLWGRKWGIGAGLLVHVPGSRLQVWYSGAPMGRDRPCLARFGKISGSEGEGRKGLNVWKGMRLTDGIAWQLVPYLPPYLYIAGIKKSPWIGK